MKITPITVYHCPLSYPVMSRARARVKESELDDTIVAIETDTGVTGYGESCPLARFE